MKDDHGVGAVEDGLAGGKGYGLSGYQQIRASRSGCQELHVGGGLGGV